jgi:predicted peptidase
MAVSCKKHNEAPPIPADVENAVETVPPVQKAVTFNVNANISGYYYSLPYYYNYTTKNYPLLLSLPGGGQLGNGTTDLPLLLNDGVAKLINDKIFPPNFNVEGGNFSFIVLTPQFRTYPSTDDVEVFINFAKAKFRIDSSRTYITGLSIGGEVAPDVAGTYPQQVSAVVPISGESRYPAICASLAKNNIPVWDFHDSGDTVINISESNNFIAWINSNNPPIPPKQTIFQGIQHDAWSTALSPSYKENNMNVYEWMLQYKKQ